MLPNGSATRYAAQTTGLIATGLQASAINNTVWPMRRGAMATAWRAVWSQIPLTGRVAQASCKGPSSVDTNTFKRDINTCASVANAASHQGASSGHTIKLATQLNSAKRLNKKNRPERCAGPRHSGIATSAIALDKVCCWLEVDTA